MDILDNFHHSMQPASIFKRYIALVIDMFLLGMLEELVSALTGSRKTGLIVEAISAILYYGALEGAAGNASIGKRVLGLRVCDTDGNDLDFTKAAIRGAGHILSTFIFGIGYVIALFNDKKQTLHDILAGTMVVNAA